MTPTYRDLPVTPERVHMHLQFALAYLEQAQLDFAKEAHGFGAHALLKRRQHQQSLADIRAVRAGRA